MGSWRDPSCMRPSYSGPIRGVKQRPNFANFQLVQLPSAGAVDNNFPLALARRPRNKNSRARITVRLSPCNILIRKSVQDLLAPGLFSAPTI